jgi:hypothetical protein
METFDWARVALDSNRDKEINFWISNVKGVAWLWKNQLATYSARWWLVWDNDSKVIIPNANNIIKNETLKILDSHEKIWITIPDLCFSQNDEVYPDQEIYMFTESCFVNRPDIFDSVSEKVFYTDFFNDKYNFLKFLKNNWFEKYLPKTQFFNNYDDLIEYVENEKLPNLPDSFYIKAWHWASKQWTWEVKTIKDFLEFKKDSLQYKYHKSAFLKWEINSYNKNSKWEILVNDIEQNFILQEDLKQKWLKLEEYSINFIIDENWVSLITSWNNFTINWVHSWNLEFKLDEGVEKICVDLAKKIKDFWYRWKLWFDFFLWEDKIPYFIETNPRNTWATNPAIFTQRVRESRNDTSYTWGTNQYLDTKWDDIFWKKYDEVRLTDENESWFVVQKPWNNWVYWIIAIWKTKDQVLEVLDNLEKIT